MLDVTPRKFIWRPQRDNVESCHFVVFPCFRAEKGPALGKKGWGTQGAFYWYLYVPCEVTLRFLCDPMCFREVSASKKSVFSEFFTGFVVFQSNFFVVSTPAYLGALLKVFLSYFQQVCMLVEGLNNCRRPERLSISGLVRGTDMTSTWVWSASFNNLTPSPW